jgi:PAS domain S-box-containing protein
MVLVLALVIASLLAIQGLDVQGAALSEVNDIALERIILIDEFIATSERVQSDVFRISVFRFMDLPEEEIQPIRTRLEQGVSDLNVIYGQMLTKWPLDETEREILTRMKEPLDDFRGQTQQTVTVVSDDPYFGVLLVRSSTVPFTKFRGILTEFLDYQQTKIARTEAEAKQRVQTVTTAIIILSFLITLAGILTTILISTRLISQPIRSMTTLMGQLANGDLTKEVGELERRDEIGAMARAVEVFRNNAIEKARAEEALRAEKERAQQYLDIAGVAFVALDSDGRITLVNHRGLEILGYQETELIGKNWFETCLPERLHEETYNVFKKLMGGKVKPVEYHENPVLTKNGEERIVAWHNTVLWDGVGDIVGILSSGEDVTERVRAEKVLKQYSERLEEMVDARTQALRDAQERLVHQEKLAILGQLAGGVAHELRNPLGAIKNSGYFLNMVLERPDSEVKEALKILEQAVGTSERIISSLLDFARPKVPLQRKVDINNVVRQVLSRIDLPNPQKIEVALQLDETLPAILVDPDQLGQAFDHIILNAIQAMSPPEGKGGQLVIESKRLDGESILVSITDTGVGIAEENQGRLFEPLFTTKAKGIGLGLALAKTLVETNRGSIEVKSENGRGSTFKVRLPVQPATA